jgi:hypothetical protein
MRWSSSQFGGDKRWIGIALLVLKEKNNKPFGNERRAWGMRVIVDIAKPLKK